MWNAAEMKIKMIMLIIGCDNLEVTGGRERKRESSSLVPIYSQWSPKI